MTNQTFFLLKFNSNLVKKQRNGKKYVISIEEYNQGKWHNLLKSLNSEIFLKQCLVFKEIHSVLFFSSTSLFYLTCNTCALNIFILLVKVAIK